MIIIHLLLQTFHAHIATWTEIILSKHNFKGSVYRIFNRECVTRFFLRKMPWINPTLSRLLVPLPKSQPELVSFDLNNRNQVGDC